jgi:Family of unknown function (DUF5681)
VPFQKGQSGNPGGRRPGQVRAIQNLAAEARKHGPLALRTIADICRKSESQGMRLAAANSLLDRGYGKPAQSVELAGELTMTHQTELFADLGIAEQRMLQDALRTIDHEDARLLEHAGGGDAEGADAEQFDGDEGASP